MANYTDNMSKRTEYNVVVSDRGVRLEGDGEMGIFRHGELVHTEYIEGGQVIEVPTGHTPFVWEDMSTNAVLRRREALLPRRR